MKFRKTVYLFLAVTISTAIFAQDNFTIDCEKIEEYKGFQGIWLNDTGSEKLEFIIKTYGAAEKHIISINGRDYKTSDKFFLPLSESYLAYMKCKGQVSCSSESSNEFVWPVAEFDRITSSFGVRWNSFHEGIDIPAGRGTPILAAESGRVIAARFMESYGRAVWLEHRNNMVTRYCHASEILVKEGDIVKKGQVIALVGSSGNSTGNHLHFEIRYSDFPLNPLDFLPYHPSVNKAQYLRKID